MSVETFVVGTLEIAPGVPEEKRAKIVEDFEGVMERIAPLMQAVILSPH